MEQVYGMLNVNTATGFICFVQKLRQDQATLQKYAPFKMPAKQLKTVNEDFKKIKDAKTQTVAVAPTIDDQVQNDTGTPVEPTGRPSHVFY